MNVVTADQGEFVGKFETHLTVRIADAAPSNSATWRVLDGWAHANAWKVLHIVLDRGVESSQPMLTRRTVGDLASATAAAMRAAEELSRVGVQVVRTKLEVASDHADAPKTDADASAAFERYFEHHVKLLLAMNSDTTFLARLAMSHGAHLSRNALRRRDDGCVERFVTQRCRGVGRTVASARLEALTSAILDAGFTAIEIEAEYVVVDSDHSLDAGWLPEED